MDLVLHVKLLEWVIRHFLHPSFALILRYPLLGQAHLLELALVFVLVEEFVDELLFLHLHLVFTFGSFAAFGHLVSFLLSVEVEYRARIFTVKVEVVDVLFVKFTALPFLFFFTATATHRRISESYNVFEFAFLVVVHFHDGRLIAYFEKGFLSHHFI